MKTYTAVAALMTIAGGAMAQTNATPTQPTTGTAAGTSMPANQTDVRDKMVDALKQAGFSDVKMMPGSYVVQAKDKSGQSVNMLITPDSVTEMVGAGGAAAKTPSVAASGAAAGAGVVAGAASTNASAGSGSGEFATIPQGERMSSTIVGTDVYNKANQDIGTIKDLALDGGTLKAYIIGVGGFLGVGDRYVAVSPSAVNLTWNANDKKWKAMMDTTADQLKSAPEFKYPAKS